MQKRQRVPSRLDLWVVATMHDNSEAERRLAAFGLTMADAKAEAKQLNQAGLADVLRLNASVLRDLFGEPVEESDHALWYELALWPEHRYRWYIAEGGRTASDGGFSRLAPLSLGVPRNWRVGDLKAALKLWVHTDEDVLRMLGEPSEEHSWWPQISLRYRSPAELETVVLTFDHGLLCAVASVEASAEK